MARPRVMWSSWTKRFATMSGWWYGRLVTPEPSMMWRGRSPPAGGETPGGGGGSPPPPGGAPSHPPPKPHGSSATRSAPSRGPAPGGGSPRGGDGGRGRDD